MIITIEAIYENGVLKLTRPLPLKEQEVDRRGGRIQHAGVDMTFAQIPAGAAIFLDANTLVYHFANHPNFGAVCTQLVKRIEQHQLPGFSSTHVLSEIAHRLMTL